MKSKLRPDFNALWARLVQITLNSGDERFRSTLLNHAARKEYICRKLGIVTDADVSRVQKRYRNR